MKYANENKTKKKSTVYDEQKPKSRIIYLDANNLLLKKLFLISVFINLYFCFSYGWAMSQYIPYGVFIWVEPSFNGLNDMSENSENGRMNEIDVTIHNIFIMIIMSYQI